MGHKKLLDILDQAVICGTPLHCVHYPGARSKSKQGCTDHCHDLRRHGVLGRKTREKPLSYKHWSIPLPTFPSPVCSTIVTQAWSQHNAGASDVMPLGPLCPFLRLEYCLRVILRVARLLNLRRDNTSLVYCERRGRWA